MTDANLSASAQRLRTLFVTLTAAVLTACTNVPNADATDSGRPAASENAHAHALHRGERLYKVSCASCHGTLARGNGPVAPILKVPVPDLTLIAARRGGAFPTDEIYKIIDGQADLTAHGPRHMPVWGYEFFGDDPDDESAHREASEKIENLLRFLQSIQRKD